MRRVALFLLLLVAAAGCTSRDRTADSDLKPTVILVSFDGWRWDYQSKAAAPNMQRLIARGVHAESLIPSFPPKTFPNHYTIVTGLYPGHHGIVANSIFDAATGRTFTTDNVEEVRDPMWWGGEPIWVTVERAGQRSASMFWVGSEAPIRRRAAALLEGVRRRPTRPPNASIRCSSGSTCRPPSVRRSSRCTSRTSTTAGHADGTRLPGGARGRRARRRLPRPPAARPRAARPDRPRQHRRRLGSWHGRRQHRARGRPRRLHLARRRRDLGHQSDCGSVSEAGEGRGGVPGARQGASSAARVSAQRDARGVALP